MVAPIAVAFVGSTFAPAPARGTVWHIERIAPYLGEALAPAAFLAMEEREAHDVRHAPASEPPWSLRGFTSNRRYTNHEEKNALVAVQAGLGRAEATCAALIPIKKSEAWWELAQDERRKIFEEDSHHIAIGMRALPDIARRLYHSRDLGEPFDFLTWFEFAPSASAQFEELVLALRATAEWRYVEREVDVRLTRVAGTGPVTATP